MAPPILRPSDLHTPTVAPSLLLRTAAIKAHLRAMANTNRSTIDPRLQYRDSAVCQDRSDEPTNEIPLLREVHMRFTCQDETKAKRTMLYNALMKRVQRMLLGIEVRLAAIVAAALNDEWDVEDDTKEEEICRKLSELLVRNGIALYSARVAEERQLLILDLCDRIGGDPIPPVRTFQSGLMTHLGSNTTAPSRSRASKPGPVTPPRQMIRGRYTGKGSIWSQLEAEARAAAPITPGQAQLCKAASQLGVHSAHTAPRKISATSVLTTGSPFVGDKADREEYYDEPVHSNRLAAEEHFLLKRTMKFSGFVNMCVGE